MWPWGHLAFGYLLFSLGLRTTRDRPPRNLEAVVLLVATQLPDLIDKPLAWTFDILPNGRSLGHSLLFAIVLIVLLGVLVTERDTAKPATAFGVGYLSHLAGDALYPALAGEYYYTTFLAYPLLPAIKYPDESTSILAHFAKIEFTTLFNLELGLALLITGLWLADGCPGLYLSGSAPATD